ncbi:Uncharacterised protein [Burkholderia pseudomallei]|nr:Uncharacterised protein [Burkholderia pseudomallei]
MGPGRRDHGRRACRRRNGRGRHGRRRRRPGRRGGRLHAACLARDLRPVPSAAERFHESDRRHHPLPGEGRELLPCAERGCLRGQHVQIADGARLVLVERDVERVLRGFDRLPLHDDFLLEDALRREVVLDVLERGEHGRPVRGDVLIVGRARRFRLRGAQARVEQRRGELRADRPEACGQREQLRPHRALKAARCGQRERREERGDRDADLLVRGGRAPLGGGDVGPPLEDRRRHVDRHRGRLGRERHRRQRERRRRLADERRDRVLVLRARDAVVDRGGLRRLELGLRLDHVRARGDALRVLVLRELQRFPVRLDGVVEQLLRRVRGAQLEVGLRERRLRGQPRVREIGGRGRFSCLLRADRATHLAPQVRLPRRIEADAVRVADRARRAARRGARRQRARRARFARGQPERRKVRRARLGDERARLPVRGRVLRDGLVRRVELVDQRIQLRIVVDRPPRAAVRAVGRLRELPAGRRFLVRGGNRRVGAVIVGPDRAAGEQHGGGRGDGGAQRAARARMWDLRHVLDSCRGGRR